MATRCVDIEQRILNVNIIKMSQFYNMGMHALPLLEVPKVGQRFKKEREGEVVWKDGVCVHVSVYREWGMRRSRSRGMREGSNERIANENMGSG